jgi:hypothetical protein
MLLNLVQARHLKHLQRAQHLKHQLHLHRQVI